MRGREILDSRGNPTVEVDVVLADGTLGRAAVPSGASTGIHEAVELRDGDKKRYLGKGVTKAVANVNGALAKVAVGRDAGDQVGLDRALIAADGTPNKGKLGANAILGVSLAAAKAAAAGARAAALPLHRRGQRPRPARADGQHHQRRQARRQQDRLPGIHGHAHRRQDASPRASAWSPRSSTSSRRCSRRPATTPTSATRAASPPTSTTRKPIKFILDAVDKAGYTAGRDKDIAIALDCASSELFDEGDKKGYKFWKSAPDKVLSSQQMIDLFAAWVDKYPIISIEDPLDQDDWAGYAAFTKALGDKVQIVGDDFFVTNTERLAKGIAEGCTNSILIKVNQIGTLTETLEAIEMAHRAGYTSVISHRSGETEDATIADIAVATNAGQIKTGSRQPLRPHRQVQPAPPHRGSPRRRRRLRPGPEASIVSLGSAERSRVARGLPRRRPGLRQADSPRATGLIPLRADSPHPPLRGTSSRREKGDRAPLLRERMAEGRARAVSAVLCQE